MLARFPLASIAMTRTFDSGWNPLSPVHKLLDRHEALAQGVDLPRPVIDPGAGHLKAHLASMLPNPPLPAWQCPS